MEDTQALEICQSPLNSSRHVNTGDEKDLLLTSSVRSTRSHDLLDQENAPKKRKNVFHVTVPKPFRFHTTSRSDSHNDDQQKKTIAPLTPRIQNELNGSPKSVSKKIINKTNLTVPRSPMLHTKYRTKPPRYLPTEEQEIQEMKQYTFKAIPVKDLGVSKDLKPQLTIPTSPAITKPKAIQKKPLTPQPVVKAHPVPDFKEPFVPTIEHRKIDLPIFTLPGDEIHKRKSNEIEEKIQRELEEMVNARKFKAQPLPSDSPDRLPPRHYYPLTHPRPFRLETESRGEKYQRYFHERLREMSEREKENQFRATPLPNLEPHIPKKPELPPPTKPIEFVFHTSTRLEERKAFDDQRKIRESVAEILREQKRKEEEVRNAEEIRRLRAELVHRAQPIKHFAPLHIRPSNKRSTKAVSPMIGEKRRKIMEEQKRLSLQSDYSKDTSIMSLRPREPEKEVGLTNSVEITDSELVKSVSTSNLESSKNTNIYIRSELQNMKTEENSKFFNSMFIANSEASDGSNTQKLTVFDGPKMQDSVSVISSELQRLVTIDTYSDMQL
ncbi:9068_t:CDS:2 [Acaulospora morrowiae]|uniref:9068_t:CDS:1 n=1 Tax=Acaulospora morrowiae TaxID=94023 RepID=A0A9N8VGE5_9GLOM|nr:9068_t:CDS:2 [Acaulospora morrowiae]